MVVENPSNDEIDLRESVGTVGELAAMATWSSLEETITLRADEARTRITEIANSVRGSDRVT
jgi:hypothetical protein